MLSLLLAACSEDPPAPRPGKQVGEACAVSTECAAGLRCVDEMCMNGTCSAAADCVGEPPGGCAAWACLGGLCESACMDAGVPDASRPDTFVAQDARVEDAGVEDDAAEEDAAEEDAAEEDAAEEDARVEDAGVEEDAAQPDAASPQDAGPCNPVARAPMAGELLLNEIHADPDATNGDANQDGMIDTTDDEFVEIANISSSTLELDGFTVYDLVQARHVFGPRTLACGEVVVVFGAGDTQSPNWSPAWVIASSGQIALNNTGDTILIGTSSVSPVLMDSYGNNANNNQSIVRTTELVPGSPFIQHTTHPQAGGRLYSPGTRVDGTAF